MISWKPAILRPSIRACLAHNGLQKTKCHDRSSCRRFDEARQPPQAMMFTPPSTYTVLPVKRRA